MSKVKHYFFGTECIIDRQLTDYSNLETNLKNLNFKLQNPPLFLNQIHSNKVIIIDNINRVYQPHNKPQADALVTNLKNIALCIITADCVPVLLHDSQKQIIAAIHAGWKGAKSGIVNNTIDSMLKMGSKAEDIICYIGPCIRQKSYEVDNIFYQDFKKEDKDNQKFFILSTK